MNQPHLHIGALRSVIFVPASPRSCILPPSQGLAQVWSFIIPCLPCSSSFLWIGVVVPQQEGFGLDKRYNSFTKQPGIGISYRAVASTPLPPNLLLNAIFSKADDFSHFASSTEI